MSPGHACKTFYNVALTNVPTLHLINELGKPIFIARPILILKL